MPAGAQLVLTNALAALKDGTLPVTRSEYISLRSVCAAWRQELLPELCTRTRLSAEHEGFWECPFPLSIDGTVKVDTWDLLHSVADSGHIVHTMCMNEAGQVNASHLCSCVSAETCTSCSMLHAQCQCPRGQCQALS